MGTAHPVPVGQTMEHTTGERTEAAARSVARRYELIVVLVAALIYLGTIVSPPALMDDVDSVQAQIARTMLESGDWVTAKLDGVKYLEKSPLIYWMMAASFAVFGVHDWSARIPVALSSIFLAWLVFRMGLWAFSARVGLYSGLVVGSCIGLFLFTRIQIPDVTLTATIALALWSFLRALDEDEPSPRNWAWLMCASMAVGLLLKGLIALVFPLAAGFLYPDIHSPIVREAHMAAAASFHRHAHRTGHRCSLAHVLSATIQNPPYFDLTRSAPSPSRSQPPTIVASSGSILMNEHDAAVPQPPLADRLQHRAAGALLAVPSSVALSLEPVCRRPLYSLSFKPDSRAGRMCVCCASAGSDSS